MRRISRPAPPTGLARVLFRVPIHLYRSRLGWLLGGRFMLLTHTGRVSGKQRQVVIEVVGRENGSYLACSGFGTGAAWYRNVLATPDATIQIRHRSIPVIAEPMSAAEGAETMATYASKSPAAARKLCRFMGFEVDGSAADFREVGRELPFVRFTPRS